MKTGTGMRNFKLFVKICNIYNTLNIHLKSNWKPREPGSLMKKFNAYAALYFVLKFNLDFFQLMF